MASYFNVVETFFFIFKDRKFLAEVFVDDDQSPPWERSDGHGVVVGVTRDSERKEGYRALDRSHCYDYYGSLQRAMEDNWDSANGDPEKARAAVLKDFQYLRDFCKGEWKYVGVALRPINDDGSVPSQDFKHALWGIESTSTEYFREVARNLAAELCD